MTRPATPKDDGPTSAPGVLGHDTVNLVVAGHGLGLVGGRDERGAELACHGWCERAVDLAHVDLAFDAAVHVLNTGCLNRDVTVPFGAVDDPRRSGESAPDVRHAVCACRAEAPQSSTRTPPAGRGMFVGGVVVVMAS